MTRELLEAIIRTAFVEGYSFGVDRALKEKTDEDYEPCLNRAVIKGMTSAEFCDAVDPLPAQAKG